MQRPASPSAGTSIRRELAGIHAVAQAIGEGAGTVQLVRAELAKSA